MQLQPVSSPLFSNSRLSVPTYDNPAQSLTEGGQKGLRSRTSGSTTLNASIETEYLNIEKYSMEFTSKDGDKVSLSMESIKYQKTLLQVDATGSPEDIRNIIDFVKKQYEDMRNQILKEFVKKMGGSIDETHETDPNKEINIPDYWNAENTSQRIVDFALQFYDSFKGAGEDFLKVIKDAIDKGFNEAKDMLGELPDPVSGLISDTHDLIMQKLDQWAREKGIGAEDDKESDLALSQPVEAMV
jgi:hypothetical protein